VFFKNTISKNHRRLILSYRRREYHCRGTDAVEPGMSNLNLKSRSGATSVRAPVIVNQLGPELREAIADHARGKPLADRFDRALEY
jgi:hypothetical protein